MWQGSQHSLDSRNKIIGGEIQGPEQIIFVIVAESLEQLLFLNFQQQQQQ